MASRAVPAERFSAVVVFNNGSSESRGGTLAVVTEWLGSHNPGIVASAEIKLAARTAPKATAPKATAPKATAPKATAPKATAPKATAPKAARTYTVKSDELPDTPAGRRLAALRAMHRTQV